MWADVGLSRVAMAVLVVAGLAACAGESTEGGEGGEESASAVIDSMQDGPPTELPEVVQVLVNNQAQDYCTGVLVSPTRVLTAAHCMAGSSFVVKAPYAPTPSQSKAKKAGVVAHSSDFNSEVFKEDAAILDLETPIRISTYPTLEDVGDFHGTIQAVAVGRRSENRQAPLEKSKPLTVRSGNADGYTTGLTSQYYSSGGDSGGPLFRVDPQTRKPLHVVIGIERQPDPPKERFTRITPAVRRLVGGR